MIRKKLKAGDQCEQCSGTGMVCWRCMSALNDCECGSYGPSKCDICDGRGSLDEFASVPADVTWSTDTCEVFRPTQSEDADDAR